MAALLSAGTVLVNPAPASATPLGSPASATAIPGRRLILVNWTPPNVPGGTIARYRATTNAGQYCDLASASFSSGLTCTIGGLTANVSYTVGVIACPNASVSITTDCSPPTNATAVTPGPPGNPTAPTVTYQGEPTTMHVSWSQPAVGAGIASYKITPTPAAAEQTGTCVSLVTAPATSCDIGGLVPGTSYTFRVIANGISNAAGSSGSSAAGPASIAKIAGPPLQPDKPTLTRDSSSGVTVEWVKPFGGPLITGFTVRAVPGDESTPPEDCVAAADETTCSFTELDGTKSYTFQVQANGDTGGGDSLWSPASDAIKPGLPGKPEAPSVELGTTAGQATVYWDAPIDGGDPTGYTVTPNPGGGDVSPSECEVAADVFHCDFTGLANAQAYTFTVTATNAAGSQTSDPSNSIISELPAKPAPPHVALGDEPGKVNLTWDPATTGGTVTYYAVTAIPAGDGAPGTQSEGCGSNLSAPSCEITGLDTDETYTFTVTAIGDLGTVESDESAPVMPAAPGMPTEVAAVLGDDPGEVTVTWAEPDDGGLVEGYTVTVESDDADDVPDACEVGPDEYECSFSGLQQDASFSFVVAAVNAADSNEAGSVGPLVPDAPGTPADVEVALTPSTPGSLTVSWTAPGGGAVDRYIVTPDSPEEGDLPDTCTIVTADDPGVTECVFPELDLARPYTFVVRAENNAGGNDFGPTTAVVPNQPGAPTNVAATLGDDPGEVTVTWDEPDGGGVVTGYTVTANLPDADDAEVGCEVADDVFECTFGSLQVDASYTFVVSAENAAGSTPAGATTAVMPDQPGEPTEVEAVLGDDPGEVTVTWAEPDDGGAVTGYTVTPLSDDADSVPEACEVGASVFECDFSSLQLDATFTFVVAAENTAGSTPATATTGLIPDEPGAPTDVEVVLGDTPEEASTATVSWSTPDTGGAVSGYKVVAVSPEDAVLPDDCEVGADVFHCDYNTLDPSKSYVFTVWALNNAGAKDAAPTEPVVPGPPSAPDNVRVELSETPGVVTVRWDRSSGGVVSEYTVSVDSPDDETLPEDCVVLGSAEDLSCLFDTLDPDAEYTFTVRADNDMGGEPAEPTEPVMPNRPNPTSPPHVEIIGIDTVRVEWMPPMGGGPVARYTVQAVAESDPDNPFTAESGACIDVEEQSCEFDGLLDTEIYRFEVISIGSGGGTAIGPRTDLVDMRGPEPVPGQPTVALGGANAVRVSWTEPTTGGPVTGYSVTASPAIATPTACIHVEKTSCIFTGLISGTEYAFTVATEGTAGRTVTGEESAPILVGPPDTPARPMVTPGDATDKVVVAWAAPAPGAGIAGYHVESIPGRIGCTVPAEQADTSCAVSGLDPAISYTFRVQAVGVTGSGSSAFSPISEPIVPRAPGRPRDVDVLAGNREIAVSWSAPADAAGRVTGYRAVASPGGAACETTGTECLITGLQNLTSYTITVTAVGLSNSPASAPSARVRPTAGVPGSPTGVQAASGDTRAVIKWTKPAAEGDGIARYIATAIRPGSSRSCATTDGETLTCTITGLANLQEYTVTVVSVGRAASGYSAPSAAATVTPSIAPDTPTGLQLVVGNRALTANWTAGDIRSGLDGYTVTATGGASPLTCPAASGITTCQFTGLTAGTTYSVSVVANGTYGAVSAPTAAVEAQALTAPAPTTLPSSLPSTSSVVTLSSTSVKAGTTVTVSGSGYAPYTGVVLVLYTGAIRLGAAVTNGAGEFTTTVTVPSTVAAGSKYIAVGGLPPTGSTLRWAKASVTILAATTAQIAAARRESREVYAIRPRTY